MYRVFRSRLGGILRSAVENAIRGRLEPYGDSFWWEGPNLWEPPVQLVLRDLCKPGSVVFDVGANVGGLTAVMSRLVGPRGVVCSFEASPRIFGHLEQNLVKQGFHNATAYHRAVFSQSGRRMRIYPGDHLNDSLLAQHTADNNTQVMYAHTVSLDDFVAETKLVPDLIKMDIEGAEFDALRGAEHLIATARPHLILEQQSDDVRCFEFLRERGYFAVNVNNYQIVEAAGNVGEPGKLCNFLFVHEARRTEPPYDLPARAHPAATLGEQDFRTNGAEWRSKVLRLAAGRYLADMAFSAEGRNNQMMCGLRADGEDVFRYHGYSGLLAGHYREWVFDLSAEAEVEFYFRFLDGSQDDSFHLTGGRIARYDFPRIARHTLRYIR